MTTELEKDVSLSHSPLPKIDMIKTTKVKFERATVNNGALHNL
jgi:hypothetical protein